MKRILLVFSLLVSAISFSQDQIISFKDLPLVAQQFISTNFNVNQISYIILDEEYFSKEYKVILIDKSKVDFDEKGNWKEIESEYTFIPRKIIPVNILNYLDVRFPNTEVVKIEKERYGYSLELKIGLDLEFNRKGKLLKIDE